MATPCNMEGRWAAGIKELRPYQSDGGASMVNVVLSLAHLWDQNAKTWVPYSQYDFEVKGSLCIISKKGELLDNKVEELCKALDWDGDPETLSSKDWTNVTLQCTTEWDSYNGGSYKVKRLYPIDSNPDTRLSLPPELQLRMQAIGRKNGTPAPTAPPPVAEAKSHTPPPIDMSMHAPVKDEPPY